MIEKGICAESCTTVDSSNTAIALGSGDLEVFATPAMIALMEAAALKAVAAELPEGSTTVGVLMNASHIKASGVGSQITAKAEVESVEGRKIVFRVSASDQVGVIGEGVHERFVVDRVKFMSKI